MARFGFCGPTYESASLNADAQRTMNLLPELNESGQGKSAIIMLGSPGLRRFSTLPSGANPQVRQELFFNGRMFACSDSAFCEVMADGTFHSYGAITTDGFPASMAANGGNQILLASAGILYIFDLQANVLTAVSGAPTNIVLVDYIDGFFLALTADSNTFQLSGLLDGTTWSGLFVAKVSVFAENVVTFIADHRELAVIGQKRSAVYYDSGNEFPFDVIPGGYIEQGGAAVFCRDRLDNSVFWLGADERGQGIAWRNNGYTPQRISNHAVEQIWAKYPRISDAISYAFQDGGHTFWHIYFPSGLNDTGLPLGASWRYDAATSMWHEVGYWDSTLNRYIAHRSQCHCFAFGKHLVGDWKSSNIYEMSFPRPDGAGGWQFCDDDGNPKRWMRRAPHISVEKERMFGAQIEFDLETGVGPQPPLTGPNRGVPTAPSTIILEDANGVLWQFTVDDNGNFEGLIVASGTPQTILLKDSEMLPSTAWKLGVTIAGNLTTVSVPFSASYDQIYPMVSTPGNHPTGILVTALGNLQTDTPDQSRAPQMCVRLSRDGGHTWGSERWLSVGKIGEYAKRVVIRRLGKWRDLVVEASGSDPVPWRFVDAYITADPGFKPTERLVHQLGKGA